MTETATPPPPRLPISMAPTTALESAWEELCEALDFCSTALILGIFAIEVALWTEFSTSNLEPTAFALGHLSACLVAPIFARFWDRQTPRDKEDRVAIADQIAIWTFLVGPMGTFASAALLLSSSTPQGMSRDTRTMVTPEELSRIEQLHCALIDHRVRLANARATIPLIDVISGVERRAKFDALSVISKRFDPAFAPTLRLALMDTDASVRILAATVTAGLHTSFASTISALQSKAEKEPNVALHWIALARSRFKYANSSLLDAARAKTETDRAVADLDRLASRAAQDHELQRLVAQTKANLLAAETQILRMIDRTAPYGE